MDRGASERLSDGGGWALGIGGHQSPRSRSETWLTPPHVLRALGEFDLDPCACPEPRPWPTAATHWTREDAPLLRPWHGRVWLNPPYGPPPIVSPWMKRMAEHGHGTALIFARTETDLFFRTVWERASALLFLRGRLTFLRQNGKPPSRPGSGSGNAGAPSVLVAYGIEDAERLRRSGLAGAWVRL